MVFLNATGNGKINNHYSLFRDLNSKVSNEEIVISEITQLTIQESSNLFRNSPLVRKIVTIYPKETKNLGYTISNSDGEILDADNEIILEAFLDASIYARIYGHCFIYFKFSDETVRTKPLIPAEGLEIMGYKLFYNMRSVKDFWEKNNVRYHKSRVIKFEGVKTYLPLDTLDFLQDEVLKSDSILDSLVHSIYDHFVTKSYGKHILENLSYLLIGMRGLSAKVATTKGKEVVDKRMDSISTERDMSRIFSYDLDNEEIGFISQTLAGVRDMMQEFKETVCVSAGYPYDKLFEKNPQQSMGGSGMQNQLVARFLWAEKIHDWAESEWLHNYKILFDNMFGETEFTLEIPFKFNMTDLEQAELENIAAQRIERLITAGVITIEEARTGYRDARFTLNIALMTDEEFEKYKEEKLKQAQAISNGNNNNISGSDGGTGADGDNNNNSIQLDKNENEWDELAKINFSEVEKYTEEFIKLNNELAE